jgi:hypothetical protein
MRKNMAVICAATAVLLAAMPAAAVDPRTIPIWVGGNIDVHNNTDQVAHDFHLEGYVKHNPVGPGCPPEPSGPVSFGYVRRGGVAVPFPNFTNTKTHMGGDIWKVTADWSSLDVNPSEVGHFGLFYDVCCRNVWLKFDGWWTDTAGNKITPGSGTGWPVLGFEVPSRYSDPPGEGVFTLAGDSGDEGIDTQVIQMDMMVMAAPESSDRMTELFSRLNSQDMNNLGDWMPVHTELTEIISPEFPVDMPAESFFDVVYELQVPGLPPVGPGDMLLVRTLATWPDEPAGRWFFHAHQNHLPEPATMALLGLGAALLMAARRRRRRRR